MRVGVLFIAAALTACSGDDFDVSSTAADDAAADVGELEASNADSSSSSTDSSSSSTDVTTGDTATAADARDSALSADTADAGPPLASSPNVVSCSTFTCSVYGSMCCGLETMWSCAPTCPASKLYRICDEKADCVGGGLCCAAPPVSGPPGTSGCMTSCEGRVQFCMTDAECVSKKCVVDDGPPAWRHGRCL